jgi:hypothetical protein
MALKLLDRLKIARSLYSSDVFVVVNYIRGFLTMVSSKVKLCGKIGSSQFMLSGPDVSRANLCEVQTYFDKVERKE